MHEVVLSLQSLAGRTGQGVRIAIIDSGVHAGHPHVGGLAAGAAFDDQGATHDDVVDRLGHGTAVAAAIHEKAPAAALLPAKVFHDSLATTERALVAAIGWAANQGATLINMSLGTANPDHAPALERAVSAAAAAGAIVVAAAPHAGRFWLPGGCDGVIAVAPDHSCDRHACVVLIDDRDGVRVRASGYPRPIPGVPPERNLRGQSFAVANATGLLALAMEGANARSVSALADTLRG